MPLSLSPVFPSPLALLPLSPCPAPLPAALLPFSPCLSVSLLPVSLLLVTVPVATVRFCSLLLARVIAVSVCVTLAASMAARLGSVCMAAFQVCLQIWLTTSLLTDGLAVAAQAILASAFANRDYNKAISRASRVLQLSVVMGLSLAAFLGFGLQFAWRLFTKDVEVMKLMRISILMPLPVSIQRVHEHFEAIIVEWRLHGAIIVDEIDRAIGRCHA
ncbi:hypothetical protein ACLOJK_036036 [Asimina triloba]